MVVSTCLRAIPAAIVPFPASSRPSNRRSYRHAPGGVKCLGDDGKWWPRKWEEPSHTHEEVITILCKDGTVTTLPSSLVSSTRYIGPLFEGDDMDSSIRSKLDRSSYMSSIFLPTVEEQGLCLGVGLFSICATNGIDATRRFNVLGFCQSIDAVAESVESTVVSRGGEIWDVKREVRSGVNECLTMALALPLLWGVPPECERLRDGIESGGGIIDKIYKEFFII